MFSFLIFIWLHCVLVVPCETFHGSTWTPQLRPVSSVVAQGLSCSVARRSQFTALQGRFLATGHQGNPDSLFFMHKRAQSLVVVVGRGSGLLCNSESKDHSRMRNECLKQQVESRHRQGAGSASSLSQPGCHPVQAPWPLTASLFFLNLGKEGVAGMNSPALCEAGKTLAVEVCALSCQKAAPLLSGPHAPQGTR